VSGSRWGLTLGGGVVLDTSCTCIGGRDEQAGSSALVVLLIGADVRVSVCVVA